MKVALPQGHSQNVSLYNRETSQDIREKRLEKLAEKKRLQQQKMQEYQKTIEAQNKQQSTSKAIVKNGIPRIDIYA